MGTILASAVVSTVRTTLVDADAVGWSDDELLQYLNEAQRAVVLLKPDANAISVEITLAAGTRQALPADGVAVFDLEFNVASGRRITLVDKEVLDETNRFWPAATRVVDVEHWCADPRERTAFVVTPPNDGTGEVLAVYGAVPEALEAEDPIGLGDHYEPVLIQLTLARAYAKNTQRQDLAKSTAAMQAATTMLGIGSQGQVAVAPRVSSSPGAT